MQPQPKLQPSQKILMLFVWFLKFSFGKPRDEYDIHDYIRSRFCPEYMSDEEFDEKEQLLRDTPGPAGIKYAYYVGNKVCGIWGAIVAMIALLIPVIVVALIIIFAYEPFMNISVENVLYGQIQKVAVGQKIFNGMHAAALGLVLAHLYKIIYFNHVKRKGLVVILPSAVAFIILTDITGIRNDVLMPFYVLAIIVLGVIFGVAHSFWLKYRKKHPKKINPYSRKAQKIRDREIREDEENLRKFIDDDTIKRRRKQIEEEKTKKSNERVHRGEE